MQRFTQQTIPRIIASGNPPTHGSPPASQVLQRAEYNDASKIGSLSVIPEKALLARRLSQCTNPILPSGVHRKALDAYRSVPRCALHVPSVRPRKPVA